MYTVSYSYYGKYSHEKSFDTYAAAKGFFNVIGRKNGVKRVELKTQD